MKTTDRNQNTKVQRAWNNRLSGINNLLYWMYATDVLNKGEKAKKDSIFRQYYRFYNDGDTPRGVLRKYGISAYNTKVVANRLEQYLEDFVCSILDKYKGKYDKTAYLEFRRNMRIEHVASRIEYGYAPENTDVIKDEALVQEIEAFITRRDAFREKLVSQNPKFESYTTSYIIENGGNFSEDDLDESAIIESRKDRLVKKILDQKTK